jgi:HAD superfamily hydrolase (TIGR01509 family)
MSEISPTAFIFDMMSTLVEFTEPPQHFERLAEELQVAPERLRQAAESAHWRYEVGLTSSEAQIERMKLLCQELGLAAISDTVAVELLSVEAGAYKQSTHLYPGAADMLRHLREQGKQTAICSNVTYMGLSVAHHLRLPEQVDYAAFSCELGLLKPDPQIYLHVCGQLAVQPEQSFYFDDDPESVEGAEATGMHGILVLHPDGRWANIEGAELDYAHIKRIDEAEKFLLIISAYLKRAFPGPFMLKPYERC